MEDELKRRKEFFEIGLQKIDSSPIGSDDIEVAYKQIGALNMYRWMILIKLIHASNIRNVVLMMFILKH